MSTNGYSSINRSRCISYRLQYTCFVSDLDIFANEDIVVFREADDVIASLIEPTSEEELEELDEDVEEVDVDVPVIGEEESEEE